MAVSFVTKTGANYDFGQQVSRPGLFNTAKIWWEKIKHKTDANQVRAIGIMSGFVRLENLVKE